GGLVDTLGQAIRVPPMLQDMQMIATSQIPINLTVGTSSDCSEIYVGDFTKVRYLMRENLYVMATPELFAGTGEIGFFCHSRVDVAVLYPQAFAVITGVRA
ncbi:MAG: phage major capsid protein, partial [Burkholderiales bacterium]|nr:phage major capsid protein [Burkholderiales bacterium]